ncbi:uncharacterized protein TNCT_625501 [Trichonephila clavata]|uniref:Endonuclease/exonuclease/phosphatase domain-containing protein n=1 Tax=Trichonephila clavata TaxID=2740835 RepID=A0A8X6IL61_TRICU|nr:uncharacterized protein TNCT_625501 [Trichonephila clavata]
MGISIHAPTEPTRFDAHGVNNTLDIALAKGLHTIAATSISELTSDHNPVNFDISLSNYNSPSISTCSFPNWTKFQTVLTESIPGNPVIVNEDDIEKSISNLNNKIQEAIHATSTYKAIHHPVSVIPSQLREKIKQKNRLRKEWQQTKYPPLKTQVNRLQREIKSAITNFHNHIKNTQLKQVNTGDNSLYKLFSKNKNKLSHIPPILGPQGLVYNAELKAKLYEEDLELLSACYCQLSSASVLVFPSLDYIQQPVFLLHRKQTSVEKEEVRFSILRKIRLSPDVSVTSPALSSLSAGVLTPTHRIRNTFAARRADG